MSFRVGVIGPKDESVDQLVELLAAAGQQIASKAVVPTRKRELTEQLEKWFADPGIDLIIGLVSATMRSALLPLITKRLVGFSDLKEVDGGRCGSTVVILVPATELNRELVDQILPRVEYNQRRESSQMAPLPRRDGSQAGPLPRRDATPLPRRREGSYAGVPRGDATPMPRREGSQAGPLPRGDGSHAGPFPQRDASQAGRDGSQARPLPRRDGSQAGPLPQRDGSQSGPLPRRDGSQSGPLPRRDGSQSGPLPRRDGSQSGPLPRGDGSQSGPLPRRDGSQSGPLPRRDGSQSGPLPRRDGSQSGPLPRRDGSQAGPLPQRDGSQSGPLPRRSPTTPPPRSSTSTTPPPRRAPTTPPPFHRPGSRTTPPPVPVEDNVRDSRPDFVLKHDRPSEAEFEEAIATIRPARLEQLPVALTPTPPPPPKKKPTKWIMVGIALAAGASVGGVLAWHERAKSERQVEPVAVHVESVTQLPDLIEISEEEATNLEPATIEMPEVPVERQGSSATQVWNDEPDDGSASTDSLPLSIDKVSIGKAIAGVRPAVKRCGVTYPWKGTVKVFMHVQKNGRVSDVKIEQAPAMTLGQCVAQAVSRARFGRTQKGGALRYPFTF